MGKSNIVNNPSAAIKYSQPTTKDYKPQYEQIVFYVLQ